MGMAVCVWGGGERVRIRVLAVCVGGGNVCVWGGRRVRGLE